MWCKRGAVYICVWQRSPLLTSSALSNTQSMSWCPTSGGTTLWDWCGSASSSSPVSSSSSPALLLSGTSPGMSCHCLSQRQSVSGVLVKRGSEVFIAQYIYAGMPAGNPCACLFPKEVAETGKTTKGKYSVCQMQLLVVLVESRGAKKPEKEGLSLSRMSAAERGRWVELSDKPMFCVGACG